MILIRKIISLVILLVFSVFTLHMNVFSYYNNFSTPDTYNIDNNCCNYKIGNDFNTDCFYVCCWDLLLKDFNFVKNFKKFKKIKCIINSYNYNVLNKDFVKKNKINILYVPDYILFSDYTFQIWIIKKLE